MGTLRFPVSGLIRRFTFQWSVVGYRMLWVSVLTPMPANGVSTYDVDGFGTLRFAHPTSAGENVIAP